MNSNSFEIFLTRSSFKDLKRINDPYKNKIKRVIEDLKNGFSGFDVKKLTGTGGYRIRIGVYRILFNVDVKGKKIIIAGVKHRKDAY